MALEGISLTGGLSAAWRILAHMANVDVSAKVGSEGRLVIPAEVRKRMRLRTGDMIHFSFDEDTGDWRIFTVEHLVEQLWANNAGGDAVDSTDLVRLGRIHDQMVDAGSEERLAAEAGQPRDEEAETQRLLSALGLA